jgi:4-methylaminobutanoate oxidase (formaldehyde-forming)
MTRYFGFRRAEEIDIGLSRAICTRITYVGELGYELFVPAEQATYFYDYIAEIGEEFGLKYAGLKALSILRLVRDSLFQEMAKQSAIFERVRMAIQ